MRTKTRRKLKQRFGKREMRDITKCWELGHRNVRESGLQVVKKCMTVCVTKDKEALHCILPVFVVLPLGMFDTRLLLLVV